MLSRKDKAVKLRKKGYSYSYIKDQLKVSKSTLSLWLRDMDFVPNKETKNSLNLARLKSVYSKKEKKKESLMVAKKAAVIVFNKYKSDTLFNIGLGLYIGEGTKSQELVRVTSSDERIILIMIKWFKKFFNLEEDNFKMALHLYPDHDIEKEIIYWSRLTKIPKKQFGKTQIDFRQKNNLKQNLVKHGTVQLTIKSNGVKDNGVFLYRKIHAMMNLVLESRV